VTLSPLFVESEEGRSLWHMGALLTFKATGDDTDGQFWLAEQTSTRGYASPVHRHTREDELFIIMDGRLRVQVGDEARVVEAGGVTFAPRSKAHSFSVESESARFMILTTPAGFENWFFETGQTAESLVVPPMPEGPPDVGKLIASLQSYGVELIAPPAGVPADRGM
jgi:quercetin dioxygenase-like cupin family protein